MSLRAVIVPVTPFQQNCSVIWSSETGEGAVIDPGGDLDEILAAVDGQQVQLTKILLTHGHLDHAGGTAELAARLQLPVEGPQADDRFWIDQLDAQARMFGMEPVKGFSPDHWLRQGDTVSVGPETLEVYHCPGHTPGHVVFYARPDRLAFVGDVLFAGSIGRTDFPRGDHATLVRSIRDRLWPLGADVTFVPGHGPTSTFGHERATNPFVGDGVRD
ncbi:MAG: MBL fold metallo-hydrolase [Gammaproteobacteria bacterium]|nr:MBL fold metallo-hydrolase [Gammaproteobacteria bacterium]